MASSSKRTFVVAGFEDTSCAIGNKKPCVERTKVKADEDGNFPIVAPYYDPYDEYSYYVEEALEQRQWKIEAEEKSRLGQQRHREEVASKRRRQEEQEQCEREEAASFRRRQKEQSQRDEAYRRQLEEADQIIDDDVYESEQENEEEETEFRESYDYDELHLSFDLEKSPKWD